ncbi:GNAT family N-acetyltransferase [Natrinema zhouii]|uniref:GNAT family N-acetyltransferase n=1 Tax=Natrinema zhouii TaxID=1710539 RepID=A0A7D6CQ74_9EURY|nr:GNAT family N-acetyltransferase [Natrinema zhouii]QLK26294.1 GNAT family N-acetyltransferase [Natrinema zhouii]
MENDPRIRRYRPEDGDQVRELHETAMRDAGVYVDTASDTDLERVFETYVDGDGEFLVSELDGSIVAMGGFRPVEETDYIAKIVPDLMDGAVELTRMRVDPDYQRRGYGRRIYEELEWRARLQATPQIVLDTMAKQTAARRLYEAQGFEEVHRERIEGFDDPFELLVYRKPLVDDG